YKGHIMLGSPSVRVVAVEPGYGVFTFGPLAISVWRGDVRAAWVRRAIESTRAVAREFPLEAVAIHLAEEIAPIPGNEARDAFLDAVRSSQGLCCATAIGEGDGFATAVMRTIVAGLTLVARPAAPLKVHATVDEASQWVVTQRPPKAKMSLTAADIAAAIESARRGLPKS
ncbi:MAG: hypothetical protein WCJ30_17055, partial [Deltaproteobacteria bacterium]